MPARIVRQFKVIDTDHELRDFQPIDKRQASRYARFSNLQKQAWSGDQEAQRKLERMGDYVSFIDRSGERVWVENNVTQLKLAFRDLSPEEKDEYLDRYYVRYRVSRQSRR